MKIAICEHLTASYWGGGEKEMFELATGLSRLGHEVEVSALPYTLEGKRKVDRSLIYGGKVKYHEGLVRPIKADVAYVMYHPFAWVNFVTRAPKIASFHSLIWFNRIRSGYGIVPKVASTLSDHLLAQELSRYDAVQVHYPSTANELVRRAPTHPKLYTIEHFIDTETFKPNGGRTSEKFTVLFVGRPVWQKGFDLFVKLAHELPVENSRFVFVGGTIRDDRISSVGMVRDPESLASIFSGAHLLVSPQRIETTVGKSVLEALACGTPAVVMSGSVDPPLRDCESLFTTTNYPNLAGVVMKLFQSWKSGTYDEKRFSTIARQYVVENFAQWPTLKRYEKMLTEVAFGRSGS